MKSYKITMRDEMVMRFKAANFLSAKDIMYKYRETLIEDGIIDMDNEDFKIFADGDLKYEMYDMSEDVACKHGDIDEWARVWVVLDENGKFYKWAEEERKEYANLVNHVRLHGKGKVVHGLVVYFVEDAEETLFVWGARINDLMQDTFGYKYATEF